MHATPTAPDIAAQFAADIQHAQRDALQTIHKMMLHLAESLTGGKPSEEDPGEARTTTQRIRLCLQAARDILRFGPPCQPGDAAPPSPAKREKVAEARRGRLRVPSEPPDDAHIPATRTRSSEAQAASKLLAAAGAEVSRFGEGGRIDSTPDSRLSTHDSPSPASPRDSSLIAQTSPLLVPVYPPIPEIYSRYRADQLPQIPPEFTTQEIELLQETLRTDNPFPKPLYKRLVDWRNHCTTYNLQYPLPFPWEMLSARNPWKAERAREAAAGSPSSRGP